MVDRLDWILAMAQINQAGLKVRFGGGLLAAPLDHFEKRRERLRIAALPDQLLALPETAVVGLDRHRCPLATAATGRAEQRGEREGGRYLSADSHLAGKGIERAVVRRKFRNLALRLKL